MTLSNNWLYDASSSEDQFDIMDRVQLNSIMHPETKSQKSQISVLGEISNKVKKKEVLRRLGTNLL